MHTLLRLEAVTAGYGGGDVLKEISLEVESGSLTCIVGPNGAGKSTVLRVISGLLKPRRGDVIFAGRSIKGRSAQAILRGGIAHIPQEHSLFADMTVQENMELGGLLLGKRWRVAYRLGEIKELFPIVKERAGERAGNLSGGQQRQIEIARALMLDPQIVLVDEPSMSLDPKTTALAFEALSKMHQAGRQTILLVEQNVRRGLEVATHAVVMEGGRVRMRGRAMEIRDNPEMGQLFFGGSLTGP